MYELSRSYESAVCEVTRFNCIFKPITTQRQILMRYRYKAVENIVRKGEIAYNKQFLIFSQYFLPYMIPIFHFKGGLSDLGTKILHKY